MVDFLKIVKRKTLLSEVLYYVLNIGLVVLLFILSQTIQSPVLAIILVLLSKWRVLAVRPRFWWTNIQANMVDIIVGVSFVSLMYLPKASIFVQLALAIGYALWLVILKPRSKRSHMVWQAFISMLLGVTALYTVSYEWPVVVVVLAMAIIGYSMARHFLYAYDEEQMVFLGMIWGLVFAQIGWLAYYWNYSYGLLGSQIYKLPQVTIILGLLSFLAGSVYESRAKNKKVMLADAILPAMFSGLLILVIMIFFNSATI